MKQKILTSSSAHGLNSDVKSHIEDGWKPIGSHKVVASHSHLRYAGSQHKETSHTNEYSQTVAKLTDKK